MTQNTNEFAAQPGTIVAVPRADGAECAPTAGKTRRPRRMAREPGAGQVPGSAKAAPEKETMPRAASKIAGVLALLRREEGVTLEELVLATNWLPHTTRAALTGLRKKGHRLEKSRRGDVTCYRIEGAA